MKQNRTVNYLRGLWSALSQTLSKVNRRASIAGATSAAAVLLIIGGIVFAQDGTKSHTVASPAQLTTSTKSDSQVVPTSIPLNQDQGASPTTVMESMPTTPTTVIGPHGETIVVPPVSIKPGQPGTNVTTTTRPTTNTGGGNGSVATPSTVPASAPTTTTTVRPAPPNSPPAVDVSVSSNSEDPTATLSLSTKDADGNISIIDIKWGDGTDDWVKSYSDACTNAAGTQRNETAEHTYATPGTQNVTITVTSVSCGTDPDQSVFKNVSFPTGNTPPVTSGDGL